MAVLQAQHKEAPQRCCKRAQRIIIGGSWLGFLLGVVAESRGGKPGKEIMQSGSGMRWLFPLLKEFCTAPIPYPSMVVVWKAPAHIF